MAAPAFSFVNPSSGSDLTYGGSVVVCNGGLFVLGSGDPQSTGQGEVYPILVRGLPLGSNTQNTNDGTLNATSGSDWTKAVLDVAHPNAQSAVGAVALVDSSGQSDVYVFWNSYSQSTSDYTGLMGANLGALTPALSSLPSQTGFVLLDAQGNSIASDIQYDVSATALGQGMVVVSTITSTGVYVGVFSVANQNQSKGTWQASSDQTFSLQQLQGVSGGNNLAALGMTLSADWYAQSGGNGGNFWLGFSLWDGNNTGYLFWTQLDAVSFPYVAVGWSPTWNPVQWYCYPVQMTNLTPLRLRRDIAGQMRIMWTANGNPGQSGQYLYAYTQPGNQAPQAISSPGSCQVISTANNLFNGLKDTITPGYITGPGTVPVQVTNEAASQATPVAEFVVIAKAGHNNEIMYASEPYGYLQQVVDEKTGGPMNVFNTGQCYPPPNPPTQQAATIIQGIIDGPAPVPNQNTHPFNFDSDYVTIATVTYESGSTEDGSRSFTQAYTTGFQTSGGMDKGWGPAWDIAVSAGCSDTSGSSESQQTVSPVKMPCNITASNYTPANLAQTVIPWGYLAIQQVQFQYTYSRFLLPPATPPNQGSPAQVETDTNSTPIAQLSSTYTNGTASNFIPYSVSPGDITSYTREAWNGRMQDLGYQGADYVTEMIESNAFTSQQVVVSDVGSNPTANMQTQGSFREWGWNFNGSFYGGVSGGEGAEIFGFGADATFSAMLGFTVSLQSDSTTSETEEWQWTVDINCPATTVNMPGVTNYTFNVYFLPGSVLWANELGQYLAKPLASYPQNPILNADGTLSITIDTNSKPWRLVYVVTAYTMVDANGNRTIYPSPLSSAPTPPSLGAPPPPFNLNLPTGGNGLWPAGYGTGNTYQYGVSFSSGGTQAQEGVESEIVWMDAAEVTGYMCAILTVPRDTTNWATARNIYRRLYNNGQPVWQAAWAEQPSSDYSVLVGSLYDNINTYFIDNKPFYNTPPPPALGSPDGAAWTNRSNLPFSTVWVPGNQVQYAVTFVFANGESPLSAWSPVINVDWWSLPTFQGVPCAPAGAMGANGFPCVGRNIYRQCMASDGVTVIESPTLVYQITDNSTKTFTDSQP